MGFLERASSALFRSLTDKALKVTANLHAHKIRLYRYKIFETEYKDKTKQLIQIVEDVDCYIDFPAPVDLSERNYLYIEELLPITALFPFKKNERNIYVDIGDEFEFDLNDELGNSATYRYQINNRSANFGRYSWYREFIVSPVRVDYKKINSTLPGEVGYLFTGETGLPTGHLITGEWYTGVGEDAVQDPNIAIGGHKDPINSIYDEYNN